MKLVDMVRKLFSGRQLALSAFFILLSRVIFMLLLFFFEIFIAHKFSKIEMAEWKFSLLLIQIIVPLATLGSTDGFRYYLSREKDKCYMHLLSSLLLLFLLSIFWFWSDKLVGVFGKIVEILFRNTPKTFGDALGFVPVLLFAWGVSNLTRYVDIVFGIAECLPLAEIAFSLAFLLSFFWLSLGSFAGRVMLGFVFGFFLRSAVQFFSSRRLCFSGRDVHFNYSIFRLWARYIKYGFPLFISSIVGILGKSIGQFIVSASTSPERFAIYSVGALEIPLVSLMGNSVAQASFPRMVDLFSKNKVKEALDLWYEGTVRVSKLTYPVIILLVVFSREIITLLYSSKYIAAYPIFAIFQTVLFLRHNSYGMLLTASGKPQIYTVFATATSICNIALSFFLLKLLGLPGPALALLIVVFLQNLGILVYVKGLYLWKRLAKDIWKEALASLVVALLLKLIIIALRV